MIQIVQAGQAGKTRYLFDMHRLRARVFRERMGWDVQIDGSGLEVDQFDLPDAIYLLACDHKDRVVGNWRLLPTTGPTMIRDVWPDFLASCPMPSDPLVWEASRFAVNMIEQVPDESSLAMVGRITAEMFCALTEMAMYCGIREIYTLYDMRIARLLKRLDCEPVKASEKIRIDDHLCQIGCFRTDRAMLERLRDASGIGRDLVDPHDLPPLLMTMFSTIQESTLKETRNEIHDHP